MKQATAILIVLVVWPGALFGAPAPHDLKVELKAVNASTGQITYPGPVGLEMKVTNLGPVAVSMNGGYKMRIDKFDHTGQQWLKSVLNRDLPLLATSGDMQSFVYRVADTAGANDSGKTFLYRASIGPGYYTDPQNANNRSDVSVRFVASSTVTTLTWKGRLTPADFTRAGATLTSEQIQKLTSGTYSLQSMVSSSTDRLVDAQRCVNCHTGRSTQNVPYRPELGQLPITKLMNHRPTPSSEIVGGYNWQNGNTGPLGKFINSTTKPEALRKIFKQWLSDGAR